MWTGGALAKVRLKWNPLSLLGPLTRSRPSPYQSYPSFALRLSAIRYSLFAQRAISRSALLAIRAKRAILPLPSRVYKT